MVLFKIYGYSAPLHSACSSPANASFELFILSLQKWHLVWHLLCLIKATTTTITNDLTIEPRSKGDPPKILQHLVQQKLMANYVPGEKDLIEHLQNIVS